jgi:hypothetical protein
MSKMTNFLEVAIRKALFRTTPFVVRANSTAYSVGDLVYNATADGNIYECAVAGTSAGSPPTFNANLGDSTTDGGVTWKTLKVGLPKRPLYLGLIRASRGYSSGIRSTAVSVGDTVIPATPTGRIYRCTTGGTTGAGEPTWATTDGGTNADGGTVVWTEMFPDLEAWTNVHEANYTGYARVQRDPADANWTAPDGTGGLTDNAAAVTFGAPTTGPNVIFGFFFADALTGGTVGEYGALADPQTINSGNPAPSFPAGALDFTYA